jgi:3-hydroxyacyl-[acyl-carrier-protein] dehydratase
MPPEALYDISKLDYTRVVADQEQIRRVNPQRFEMEHLNGILLIDDSQYLIIGYKDVRADEFWVRGHMPGYPLLPGVLMCEAAAQLCSYYVTTSNVLEGDFIGLAGLDNVRVRGGVYPGDRLVLVAKGAKIHRKQVVCNVQGFVGSTMVFQADVIGMPLTRQKERTDAVAAED